MCVPCNVALQLNPIDCNNSFSLPLAIKSTSVDAAVGCNATRGNQRTEILIVVVKFRYYKFLFGMQEFLEFPCDNDIVKFLRSKRAMLHLVQNVRFQLDGHNRVRNSLCALIYLFSCKTDNLYLPDK